MRKIIFTTLAAAGSFGLAMGVAHASAGSLPFKSPTASMLSGDGDAAPEDVRSALNTMIDRFLTVDVEAQAATTAAGEPEPVKGECPEDSDTKVADAEGGGAEEAKKKDPVGPEPIYFAF